ncbi:MAG: hypothetical protein ACLQAH_17145 [Limisphaerales bacterium]
MNEDPKTIAELRQALLAEQEKYAKLERRVTTLEMQQSQNQGARFTVYEEELGKMQQAINLLKQQMANVHHMTQ